jgi:hypothetical protein
MADIVAIVSRRYSSDLDGDGRLDAVTGQGEGANNRKARVYLGTTDNPVDNRAPVIVAAQKPSAALPNKDLELRFAVADRVSSDGGPRVRAFVKVAVDGGMASEIPARFMGGSLFRAVIPLQKDGASVVVEFCAEDKRTNAGCAPKHTIAITSSAAATGASGAGGGIGWRVESAPARWSPLALAAVLGARRRGQKRTTTAAEGPQNP